MRDGGEATRRTAAYTLKVPEIGTKRAVRTLIGALQDSDALIRRAAATALGEIHQEPTDVLPALVRLLQDSDQQVREHAAIAMAKIGLPAVPFLIQLLDRTSVPADPSQPLASLQREDARLADLAAVSLAQIGPPAVSSLIEAVRNQKGNAASYARFIVRATGKRAYPSLLTALNDKNPDVHSFAAEMLIHIPGDARAIPMLNRLLRSTEEHLRRDAAYALAAIGQEGDQALVAALQDPNPEVRFQACRSLERDDADPFVVSALAQAVKDPSVEVRQEAVRVLHNIGPSAKSAVPALTAALSDPEAAVREGAASALGYFGGVAAESVPALIAAISDPDEDVRRSAIEALASMGTRGTESIPALTRALQDESMVYSAATTLGELGKPAQSAIPALRKAVKGPQGRRREVLYALGELKAQDDSSVAVLMEALTDPDPYVNLAAASSLAKIGPAASRAVPALIHALEQKNMFGHSAVIEALVSIGPAAAPDLLKALAEGNEALRADAARALAGAAKANARVLAGLVKALSDPSADVRISVAKSLGEMGWTSEEAITALVGLLRDGVLSVRVAAANALAAIGEKAVAARPALFEMLQDADKSVRDAALDALPKLGVQPKEMALLLTPLLASPNAAVRRDISAMLVRLGQVAVPVLEAASKDANSILRKEASAALRKLALLADPVTASIQQLKDVDPGVREQGAVRLRQLGARAMRAGPALVRALKDNDIKVRTAAAESLVEIGVDISAIARELNAILWESYVQRIFAETLPDLIEVVRPSELMAGRIENLPALSWPPPRFSAWQVLPKEMIGPDNLDLKAVHDRLSSALTKAGFEDQGLFEVPGGFAIVTKVERIYEDGSSWAESERWSAGKIPLRSLSLAEYLRLLFLEKPGHFRLFAFVVTTEQNMQGSTKLLPEPEARELLMKGGRILPERIQRLSFRGHYCHTLIYHFEKKIGEGAAVRYPSPLSPRIHLTKAGILTYLGG
jgi:HEAT repeat protein